MFIRCWEETGTETLDVFGSIYTFIIQANNCVLITSHPLFQLLKEVQIQLDIFTDLSLGLTNPFQEVCPLWVTRR